MTLTAGRQGRSRLEEEGGRRGPGPVLEYSSGDSRPHSGSRDGCRLTGSRWFSSGGGGEGCGEEEDCEGSKGWECCLT